MSAPGLGTIIRHSFADAGRGMADPRLSWVLLLPLLIFNLGHLSLGLFPLPPPDALRVRPVAMAAMYGLKLLGLLFFSVGLARLCLNRTGARFALGDGGVGFVALALLDFAAGIGGMVLLFQGGQGMMNGDAVLGLLLILAGLAPMAGARLLVFCAGPALLLGYGMPGLAALLRQGVRHLPLALLLPLILALPVMALHAGLTRVLMGMSEPTTLGITLSLLDSLAALAQVAIGVACTLALYRRVGG